MQNFSTDSHRMKNLVDISAMVTSSTDFYSIKDKIVEKMLEVVHPTKACVNLFHQNNYKYAYLVCSETLDYIPQIFPMNHVPQVSPMNNPIGVKIDFNEYPKYVHEAVKEKKIIYVEDVFEEERAKEERDLAINEGYVGRIVFPFIINDAVVGFMTCFLGKNDNICEQDIDFISSVASLLSLSIEITTKNNNTQFLVHKLRGAINAINDATKKLYSSNDMTVFLEQLSKQACNMTNSKEALILVDDNDYKNRAFNYYNVEDKNKINLYPMLESIQARKSVGEYHNNVNIKFESEDTIKSYIYYKLRYRNKVIGCIVCANSQNYTRDDLNTLSILAKQVSVGMQLYKYNLEEVKHKVLDNELNLLSKQQKLIMDDAKLELSNNKELDYYHRPARVVGGDFYYAMKVDDNNTVFIVADVMGHGMISNYVVAMIKGAFKVLANNYKTPGEILTKLNNMLYDEFDKMDVFTTCLVGVINSKENKITISNAGHYSPIIIKNNGEIEENLNCKKGIPIGIMDEAEYANNSFDISNYSLLCMYTDGILEIKNESKEEYGVSRLEKFLQDNYQIGHEVLQEKLEEELIDFAGKDNFDDDILVVMLKEK